MSNSAMKLTWTPPILRVRLGTRPTSLPRHQPKSLRRRKMGFPTREPLAAWKGSSETADGWTCAARVNFSSLRYPGYILRNLYFYNGHARASRWMPFRTFQERIPGGAIQNIPLPLPAQRVRGCREVGSLAWPDAVDPIRHPCTARGPGAHVGGRRMRPRVAQGAGAHVSGGRMAEAVPT